MSVVKNKKTICLYTGSNKTKSLLCSQLKETFGDYIELIAYAIDEEDAKFEKDAVLLMSSESVEKEMLDMRIVKEPDEYIVCKRILNFDYIGGILNIPKGENVLFVNDTKGTTHKCILALKDIGITHIKCDPFYPGCEIRKDKEYKYAITAGESHLVPDYIEHIVDVGPRLFDMPTLIKILDKMQLEDYDVNRIVKPYTDRIIDIAKKMVVLNAEAEGVKNILKQKLTSKGHTAKYNFDNIRGCSNTLEETKRKAEKLAKTELSILIEGESGTGKELFASAIHNASGRKDGPYLAVNFGALPEEIVESELFGYEEGAFTGAKKGGKVGLFQQADGGTIFLDEVGDISPRVQTKLLRVLQEREVMPVGGSNIQKVDIRVLAATNKDLKAMVQAGTFRDDLYYRLKIGYINVPPLRKRKEDIRSMVEYFIEHEEGEPVEVEQRVYERFYEYDWSGNVRELRNIVKYMLAIRDDKDRITINDLPDEHFFDENVEIENNIDINALDLQQRQILVAINNLNRVGKNAGRSLIAEVLRENGMDLSESQVRNRLEVLQEKGFVTINRGKSGTILTTKGRSILDQCTD